MRHRTCTAHEVISGPAFGRPGGWPSGKSYEAGCAGWQLAQHLA